MRLTTPKTNAAFTSSADTETVDDYDLRSLGIHGKPYVYQLQTVNIHFQMKKPTLFLILILTTTISVNAQFEVGLTGIPSISTFHAKGQDLSETYIYPLNYGLSVNYHLDRFMFSSGVLHFTQGRKFELEETSTNNPEGTGEFYDVYFRARSLMVPLLAHYKFIQGSNSSLFGGIGIYTGYIYSQEQENTSIPEDWQPDPSVNYSYPVGRFTEQDIFSDLYFGLNIGIGWNQKISDNLSLQLRPNFLYQLREEQPKSTNAWTNRMMTWALDFGIYYRLEKK